MLSTQPMEWDLSFAMIDIQKSMTYSINKYKEIYGTCAHYLTLSMCNLTNDVENTSEVAWGMNRKSSGLQKA